MRSPRPTVMVFTLLAASTIARAGAGDDDGGLQLKPAAVPTFTYGSDEGFGTGGVGTLYFHKDGVLPYKAALTLNIFITTRLIQQHRIRFETLRLFDQPLRVLAQVGYYSTVTQTFCGYGNQVSCHESQALDAAAQTGRVPGTSLYELVRNKHHQMRFVRLWGEALARYALWDKPHRLEVWGGWRGSYYIPGEVRVEGLVDGNFFLPGPYPLSRWEKQFPNGEPGFSSAMQVGFALDNRDRETQPDRGYFVEGSVRAASPFIGSTWNWLGANATGAIYAPLIAGNATSGADLVLAHRLVFDVMAGDVPTEDLARLGGLTDYIAVGGSDIGRGIREHRYLGKVKLMSQTELRWSFAELELLNQHLKFGVATFLDAAWVGYDVFDWRGRPLAVVGGAGGGLRLLWNRDFAVRLDVGVSPHERYEPRMYIRVGNPF